MYRPVPRALMMVFPTRATSNQMVDWGRTELALTLNIPKENVRLLSPFVGGGFGAKLFLRTDALLAALGARAARSGACAFNAGIERALQFLTLYRIGTTRIVRWLPG